MTLLRNFDEWRAYRRAVAEMSRLPDEALHDMGVPRWRVREVARGEAIRPEQVI